MKQEVLQSRLVEHGLEKHFLSIMRLARPCIRLEPESSNEAEIEIGTSKIGGMPDVPPGFVWPSEEITVAELGTFFGFLKRKKTHVVRLPLAFLGQINLAEVAPQDQDQQLPPSGMLYFFYVADQSFWGESAEGKSKFAVRYHDVDAGKLKRCVEPTNLPEEGRYQTCKLNPVAEISLPSWEHSVYDFLEQNAQDTFFDKVGEEGDFTKLLGYADEIQGRMEEECESMSRKAFGNIAPGNWHLLFQLDSVDDAGMCWGDVGRLYFWIKEQDLKNRRFDRCWMSFQCY